MGRIETHLDSLRDQRVSFPNGEVISFAEGEAIRTEVSCKYDRPTIDALFAESGLQIDRWVEDERAFYALVLGSLTA
jgi:L-histidine N-alpha-methyltransferase